MLLAQDARPELTESEAAARLGLGCSTLRKMRSEGRGPAYFKIGGSVRYDPVELQAYIGRHRVAPANEARA